MFSSHVKGSPLEGTAQAPVPSATRPKELSRAERKAARLAQERSGKALREAARQCEKAARKSGRSRGGKTASSAAAPTAAAPAAAPAVERAATSEPGTLAPPDVHAPAPANAPGEQSPSGGRPSGKQKPRREKAPNEKARKSGDPADRRRKPRMADEVAGAKPAVKRRGVTIKLARHPQESRPKAPLQPSVVLKPKPSRRELLAQRAAMDPYAPQQRGGIDLALSSLVLGGVAFALAWIPLAKYVGAAFAALGVLLAYLDIKRDAAQGWLPGGMTRWGRTLSVAALVVVVATTGMAVKAGADADKKASGTATGMVLEDDLSTNFGEFTETRDAVGVTHRGLLMTVKNKSGGVKSFDILVEAVNGNGERITSEQISPRNMRPGQEIEYKLFQYVDDLTAAALRDAEVRVGSASSH